MTGFSILRSTKNFFAKGEERTLRAKKNIIVSFITKVLSILISFLIVPITLGYVGKEEYGIWMTISSIIAWFNLFDIGLGNGLRTKFAEALALKDIEKAKIYVSSTFALIIGISILMFSCFYIVSNFISWTSVLNTSIVPNVELKKIIVFVFFFFCINFVLKLFTSVLQALQRNAISDIINFFGQLFGLLAIFVLVKTTSGSLFYMCLVYGGSSAVVMLFASIIFFNGSLKEFKPSLKFVHLKRAMPLLHLGLNFFVGQIFYMVISQSSVILVAQFFGPKDVTVFNLGVRYMSIISMIYIMVLTPFLSAFTEAFTKNDYEWIKHTIKRINNVWVLCSFVTILLVVGSDLFFKLWVGDKVIIPISLIMTLAISSILNTWGATYSLFMNGIGKIKIQIYFLGAQAVLFIPLSYLFFRLHFGLSSIVMTQITFYIFNALIYTFQYKQIINNKAVGIWNK